MKKYKKSKNKTPINTQLNNLDPIKSISYREKPSEKEFIYVVNPNFDKSIKDRYSKDDIEETLKRKTKSIDNKTEYNQNKEDMLISPKKSKKRIIKKKKKSVKKEITNKSENTVNDKKVKNIINEIETPTPNGNDDEIDNFYLIDYQSRIYNTNDVIINNITEKGESNYNTFGEKAFE